MKKIILGFETSCDEQHSVLLIKEQKVSSI